MLILRFVASALSISVMLLGVGTVSGQTYPNKAIRFFTSEPGGSGDFGARLTAPGLSEGLGQPVIVDNRSALIAIETVAKAPPDGYSLLFYGNTTWLAPFLLDNVSYDPVRDFSPITLVASTPYVLVVHPSMPVKSVKELIALAKAKPGVLNYSSGPAGGGIHLAAKLFEAMAGVTMVHVPYKGSGRALTALVSGEVQLMFPTVPSATPLVKTGRSRALAVTSAEPSALFPGLPSVAASGLPGYETVQIVGVFAPAKAPAALINRLNQETVRVLNRAEVKEKFFNAGSEVVGSSPEQFAATVKADIARWGKLIKDAGIKAN